MKAIKKLHHKLIAQVGNLSNKSVLDYGCGRGGMLDLLLQCHDNPKLITAVDSNEEMVGECQKRFANFINTEKLFVLHCSNPSDLSGKSLM